MINTCKTLLSSVTIAGVVRSSWLAQLQLCTSEMSAASPMCFQLCFPISALLDSDSFESHCCWLKHSFCQHDKKTGLQHESSDSSDRTDGLKILARQPTADVEEWNWKQPAKCSNVRKVSLSAPMWRTSGSATNDKLLVFELCTGWVDKWWNQWTAPLGAWHWCVAGLVTRVARWDNKQQQSQMNEGLMAGRGRTRKRCAAAPTQNENPSCIKGDKRMATRAEGPKSATWQDNWGRKCSVAKSTAKKDCVGNNSAQHQHTTCQSWNLPQHRAALIRSHVICEPII